MGVAKIGKMKIFAFATILTAGVSAGPCDVPNVCEDFANKDAPKSKCMATFSGDAICSCSSTTETANDGSTYEKKYHYVKKVLSDGKEHGHCMPQGGPKNKCPNECWAFDEDDNSCLLPLNS